MIYSVALLIAVLCGLTFWAPYAMEQSRQAVVQSRWFTWVLYGYYYILGGNFFDIKFTNGGIPVVIGTAITVSG